MSDLPPGDSFSKNFDEKKSQNNLNISQRERNNINNNISNHNNNYQHPYDSTPISYTNNNNNNYNSQNNPNNQQNTNTNFNNNYNNPYVQPNTNTNINNNNSSNYNNPYNQPNPNPNINNNNNNNNRYVQPNTNQNMNYNNPVQQNINSNGRVYRVSYNQRNMHTIYVYAHNPLLDQTYGPLPTQVICPKCQTTGYTNVYASTDMTNMLYYWFMCCCFMAGPCWMCFQLARGKNLSCTNYDHVCGHCGCPLYRNSSL